MIKPYNYQNLFFTKIDYDNNLKGDTQINLDLIEESILLVTGIANSEPIVNFLKKSDVDFEHISYSDHFNYSQNDINRLEKNNNRLIITTEKDFQKIQLLQRKNKWVYLEGTVSVPPHIKTINIRLTSTNGQGSVWLNKVISA